MCDRQRRARFAVAAVLLAPRNFGARHGRANIDRANEILILRRIPKISARVFRLGERNVNVFSTPSTVRASRGAPEAFVAVCRLCRQTFREKNVSFDTHLCGTRQRIVALFPVETHRRAHSSERASTAQFSAFICNNFAEWPDNKEIHAVSLSLSLSEREHNATHSYHRA